MQHTITKSILNTEIILSITTEIILPKYYASIMPDAFRYLLCLKLCQCNRLVPSEESDFSILIINHIIHEYQE